MAPKLKTTQFRILTRGYTAEQPPVSLDELMHTAVALREPPPQDGQRYRLAGIALGNFRNPEQMRQPALF